MNELSAWTQLTILLTARWSVNGGRPLAPLEFSKFRQWLGPAMDGADRVLARQHDLAGSPIETERLDSLLNRAMGVFQSVDRWLQAGIWVRSWADEGYPTRFKRLKHRAPVLLFGHGDPNAYSGRALAIVGSRDASESKLREAAEVAGACARDGITVVSGGARGVDLAAMEGALELGTVVGVLADSLLKEAGNSRFRRAIQDHRLCLMSEVHPEARFDVGNAMARNRLAYASADAALVVECDANRGGTWAGALDALKSGTPVYVLHGARAERELTKAGAIPIDMQFALRPFSLLKGERLDQGSGKSSAVVAAVLKLLEASRFDYESLSAALMSEAASVATTLLNAAEQDGLAPSGNSAIGESREVLEGKSRKRSSRKKKDDSIVGTLPL